jgi:HEAT repeat protein
LKIELLLKELKGNNQARRARAAERLRAAVAEGRIDAQNAETLTTLTKLINFEQDWNVRQTVLAILDETAPRETVAKLLKELRSRSRATRQEAAHKFTRITESMFPALVREIKRQAASDLMAAAAEEGEQWAIRASAISVLGKIKHEEALPVLVSALGSENHWVRDEAAIAIANYRAKAAAAVTRLIEALRDPTADAYAAQALGAIGAAAISAVPSLERAARDGDEELAEYAAQSAAKIKSARKRVDRKSK